MSGMHLIRGMSSNNFKKRKQKKIAWLAESSIRT